jgi:hypothetical protein
MVEIRSIGAVDAIGAGIPDAGTIAQFRESGNPVAARALALPQAGFKRDT